MRIAYQTGRLDTGSGGLGSVPIIDYRAYRDLIADPHESVAVEPRERALSLRTAMRTIR